MTSIVRICSLSAKRCTRLAAGVRLGLPWAGALTLALVSAGMVNAGTASAAPPPVGALTALSGQAGCVTAPGGNPACAQAAGVDGASSAVVSPDGRNVYLASYEIGSQEGLSVFSRDASTGALTQLHGSAGCLSADGNSALGQSTCAATRGFGVGDGRDLVFTSDGRWAYLVNQHAQQADPVASIVVVRRDPATGALSQAPGSDGCISSDGGSQDGPGTCEALATLGRPFGIAISSDDDFVYVTDYGAPSRIHVLARDSITGALHEVQCLSEAPVPAGCAAGRVLGGSKALVISPDGRHAYSSDARGISILDRDPVTGLLTQKSGTAGCITDTGDDDTGALTCASGRALQGANALAVAPGGATVYVAATTDHGVSVFHVAGDGSLAQLMGSAGCITLSGGDGLGNLSCATARALTFPFGIAVSPDGGSLYVIGDNNQSADGVAVFSLDAASGAATQLAGPSGCITADGTSGGVAGACAEGGPALEGIYDPTISPDGASVYLPGYDGRTLGVYRRETGPRCQAASVVTPYQTAATVSLHCLDGDGDPITTSIAALPRHGTLGGADSASGTVVYTPQAGYTGTDSFAFSASDGTNVSSPATATVAVQAPVGQPLRPPPPHAGHPKATALPRLANLRQSMRRWHEIRSDLRRARTMFSFVLNEAARVTFTFSRSIPGRRAGDACVAPNLAHRSAARCVRSVTVGTLSVEGRVGQNRVAFSGHLPRHGWLPPGPITLTAIATAAGHRSAARHLAFVITTAD